ncbi:MAG: hypothetical protein IPK67_19750 [Planctomycetes bacterium]|nr:hypothetical protein [Planctomycetota bacterium]
MAPRRTPGRLPAGVYDFAFIAWPTTPGRFTAAPAEAEEMFSPETFGRSGVDVLVVE